MRMRACLAAAGVAAFLLMFVADANAAAAQELTEIPYRSPYIDLVRKYHSGDFGEAIAGLLALDDGDRTDRAVHDLGKALREALDPRADQDDRLEELDERRLATTQSRLIAAAAVLHVEVGRIVLIERDVVDADTERTNLAVRHLKTARFLVDWPQWKLVHDTLQSTAVQAAHQRLRRAIHLAIAWTLNEETVPLPLLDHLDNAREQFPEDAEVWLASGAAQELMAGPYAPTVRRAPGQVNPASWRRLQQEGHLREAESHYREALARDPNMAEAHLRLGRLLHLRNARRDARPALERARDLAQDDEIRYLAAIFLAALTADEGDRRSARAQYEAIVKAWPDCHAAHVGLSHAYEASGDRQAALGALRPLWQPLDKRRCPADAWSRYLRGPAWRLVPQIAALRTQVTSWP